MKWHMSAFFRHEAQLANNTYQLIQQFNHETPIKRQRSGFFLKEFRFYQSYLSLENGQHALIGGGIITSLVDELCLHIVEDQLEGEKESRFGRVRSGVGRGFKQDNTFINPHYAQNQRNEQMPSLIWYWNWCGVQANTFIGLAYELTHVGFR